MPAFPPQNSTARCLKQILEMYCLNISLSHAMSQTPHQAYILMLTNTDMDWFLSRKNGKCGISFYSSQLLLQLKWGQKPMIMYRQAWIYYVSLAKINSTGRNQQLHYCHQKWEYSLREAIITNTQFQRSHGWRHMESPSKSSCWTQIIISLGHLSLRSMINICYAWKCPKPSTFTALPTHSIFKDKEGRLTKFQPDLQQQQKVIIFSYLFVSEHTWSVHIHKNLVNIFTQAFCKS